MQGEANYRLLKRQFKEADSDNWVLMPVYPFGPNENLLDELTEIPPTPPGGEHIFGTDDRGRDVFARLVYGFNIGISFSLIVTIFSYMIGISTAQCLDSSEAKVDILGQRFIEIWSTLPFLFVMIIISSILNPNFWLLTKNLRFLAGWE